MSIINLKIKELLELFFQVEDSADFDFAKAQDFFNKNLRNITLDLKEEERFGDILSDLDSFFNTDIRIVDPGYYNFETLKREIISCIKSQ